MAKQHDSAPSGEAHGDHAHADAHGASHGGAHGAKRAEGDAHAADGEHDAHTDHAAHGKHKQHAHDAPPGTPPWLISFGDMMTLFLCFFIMLVTMAKRQDAGLVAAGLGPFVAALENRGNDLPLDGAETMAAVNRYRKRFGLAPITEDQLQGAAEVASATEIEKLVKTALRPYAELDQPLVAVFAEDSAKLDDAARRYLDLLADTLRPGRGQLLVLEGHADDAGSEFARDNAWLATARAQAVKVYLLEEHGFIPQRVEARAWAVEVESIATGSRGVDARLVQPEKKEES